MIPYESESHKLRIETRSLGLSGSCACRSAVVLRSLFSKAAALITCSARDHRASLCIYSELAPSEEHFYTFDPLKGKGNE
jgi:hypothetical protein